MIDLHHIESEQSVLGGLLLDPKAHERIDWLKEADFYRDDHRVIYRHIVMLLTQNKPVDVITVAESLGDSGSEIGLDYLGELAHNTPSTANIHRYAEVVREKRQRRELLVVSGEIAEIAQSQNTMPIEARFDAVESLIFSLVENQPNESSEPEMIGSVLSVVVEDVQRRFENGGEIAGLSTGFSDLDHKTCGLHPGDLIIIAGRPSMGKTAIALNIAEHVAVEMGKTTAIFSMEMSKKQLTERAISSVGSICGSHLRSGQMTDDDFSRMSFAIGKIFESPLVIDETPSLSVAQIRSRCRRIARKRDLSLVVVDYIQLARGEGQNREQEVSAISRGLKAIAKEFGVPVIALSQLSRKVEERTDKRPMMSDLRESGAIEQDADVILMMYREEYYKQDTPDKGIAEVIIGKQRMGETGTIRLAFQGEYSRFRNLSFEEISRIHQAKQAANDEKAKKTRRGME